MLHYPFSRHYIQSPVLTLPCHVLALLCLLQDSYVRSTA